MLNIPVIIVNYNSHVRLKECLSALKNQTLLPSKIVIVDNGSGNNDQAFLATLSEDPYFHIIQLKKNHGFAKANNIALKTLIKHEYVALLNPDAIPNTDWLSEMVEGIRANPNKGSYASVLMNYKNNEILDGIGDCYHISGLAWRKGHGKRVNSEEITGRTIFSACAAAACYNTKAFFEVGGFDEKLFCYLEDIDLGFRMQLSGYSSVLVPKAIAKHIGSETTGRRSDFSVYYGHRNLEWVFFKNMPTVLLIVCLPIHLLMVIFLFLIFCIRGQGRVYCKAKFDALKGCLHPFRERKNIHKKNKLGLLNTLKIFSYIKK
jgi:GT2 family glycosyltransferase